ncbi:hypothetical protein ACFL22_00360 [Patescibacteria group bacterium]
MIETVDFLIEHSWYAIGCVSVPILAGAYFSLKKQNGMRLFYVCFGFVVVVDEMLFRFLLSTPVEIEGKILAMSIVIMFISLGIFHALRKIVWYKFETRRGIKKW